MVHFFKICTIQKFKDHGIKMLRKLKLILTDPVEQISEMEY